MRAKRPCWMSAGNGSHQMSAGASPLIGICWPGRRAAGSATSGRAILKALIAGDTDPTRLADLTTGRLKASRAQLIAALQGRVTAHHRFMIDLHLTQIEALDGAVRNWRATSARPSPAFVPPPSD